MAAPTCFSMLCNAKTLFRNVVKFRAESLSLTPLVVQKRFRRRSSVPPSYFAKQHSKIKPEDEHITAENREFIDTVIQEKYDSVISSPLKESPWERELYTPRTRRTGILAVKIGTMPQWTVDGEKIYTTLLQVLDNHVIKYTPPEDFYKSAGWQPQWRKKYGSLVVGALSSSPLNFEKEYNSLFEKSGVPPKRKLTRFLITDNAKIQPGTPLNASHFRVGDVVDVQAKTVDYGFQGAVKRWGMKGGPKTHGTTKAHRRVGTIACGKKHGIWKGKKMPGHMGDDWDIQRGLKIWRINHAYNVLYIHGLGVPGPTHCYVRVMDTILPRRRPVNPPAMPTFFPEDLETDLADEVYDDSLHVFKRPSIKYE